MKEFIIINNNNKSGFKEPSSNQNPLKTLYNDGKTNELINNNYYDDH